MSQLLFRTSFAMGRAALLLSLCILGIGAQASEKTGNTKQFDGVWQTTLSCENSHGALGYSFRFSSTIKNGVLHGEKGTPHEAGWLQIDGSLSSDGVADLYVDGLVGGLGGGSRSTPRRNCIRLSRDSSIFGRPRGRSSGRRAALLGDFCTREVKRRLFRGLGSAGKHEAIESRGAKMNDEFPCAAPEIPVTDVPKAAVYYENCLGFHWDWGVEGIGQVSRGGCRIFLTDNASRGSDGTGAPAVIWLNVNSRKEVDELYRAWSSAGARIVSKPEAKPWNLHEFTGGARRQSVSSILRLRLGTA